jgi:hypothetical protein
MPLGSAAAAHLKLIVWCHAAIKSSLIRPKWRSDTALRPPCRIGPRI